MSWHPSLDDLKLFALGEGDEQFFEKVESHVLECEMCQSRLESFDTNSLSSRIAGAALDAIDLPLKGVPAQLSSVSPEMATQVAQQSRYRLDGEIARGGMGAILKGHDTDLGRDIAIKVLLDKHCNHSEFIERFIEEAQIGGQLQHPGIVPVYELGQFGQQRPYFSMKLVKGETLAMQLAARTELPQDRTKLLGVFEQVCQAIAYAHSRRVIHRDLKPSNVMIGTFGEVQVMDWGLAKLLHPHSIASTCDSTQGSTVIPQVGTSDSTYACDSDTSVVRTKRNSSRNAPLDSNFKTQLGSVIGTPAYMPPEQALGQIDRLDERTDVFGLGAILCEILTGYPPYTTSSNEPLHIENRSSATNLNSLTATWQHEEISHLASAARLEACYARLANCDADPSLIQLVRECLAADPKDRPNNAQEVAARITGYLESVEHRAHQAELSRLAAETRASEEQKRRRLVIVSAAALLLTVAMAGGGWLLVLKKESEIETDKLLKIAQVERLISDELSTARALTAKLHEVDSVLDIDAPALATAREAVDRANSQVADNPIEEALVKQTIAMQAALSEKSQDYQFITGLDNAWRQEMESLAEQVDSLPNMFISHGPRKWSDEQLVAGYQRVFDAWGLHPAQVTVQQAAARIGRLTPRDQSIVIAAMERWLQLLHGPWTFEQWQATNWTVLQPVQLVSRGGDQLAVLDDQSILASGDHPRFGYDLEFETSTTELSALRLELMTDESLPKSGPGRSTSSGGTVTVEGLRCWVTPKDADSAKKPVIFRSATSDYGFNNFPLSTNSWQIPTMARGPHTAVFELEATIYCSAGFRVSIRHDDRRPGRFEDQNMGRFRWSSAARPDARATADWLDGLVDAIDGDPWRRELRKEIRAQDLDSIVRRASDWEGLERQPHVSLIQLAESLRDLSAHTETFLPEVDDWQVVHFEQIKQTWHHSNTAHAQPAELSDDGSIVLLNPRVLPDLTVQELEVGFGDIETVTLLSQPIMRTLSALRLELIPTQFDFGQEGSPQLGRNSQVDLADVKAELMDTNGTVLQRLEFDSLSTDHPWDRQLNLSQSADDTAHTLSRLRDGSQTRQIVFAVVSTELPEKARLRISLVTRHCENLGRFRFSISGSPMPRTNISPALRFLTWMNRRDPSNYWVALELAQSLLRESPPNYVAAKQLATSAVALQPDKLASHIVRIRSLGLNELTVSSPQQHTLHHHAQEIRRRDPQNRFLLNSAEHIFHYAHWHFNQEKDLVAAFDNCFTGYLLHPTYAKTRWGVSFYLDQMIAAEQFEDALSATTHVIAVDPSFAWAYIRQARALLHLGRAEEAHLAMERIGEMTPEDATASNDLAWHLTTYEPEIRLPSQAIRLANRAIEIEPGNFMYWNTLGVAHYRNGDFAAAIESLNKSLEISTVHGGWNWIFLAMAHKQLGDDERAKSNQKKAQGWMEKWASKNMEFVSVFDEAEKLIGELP